MQLTNVFFATLLAATSAVAAPTPADVSMMAAAPEWIIKDLKRICNSADTQCTWTFAINPQNAKATDCTYVVKGTKASQALAAGPVTCGNYQVTSGWSGQFGPGNGFTTLSVVDTKQRLIVWPAYTDNELAGGKTVSPNKKYAPAALP
ncbi:hypothetical protein S7711_02945 [Stachybotrys chartarum IBT 7711]|uniref:Small secreted protein n=1 Tax=Stachybotrys chartarum (strain CBS 109288 / IBT 7711) TaxID=1280523 RepID=A0A084B2D7_STACB|nr:hypothetical protein S7711_02945 [Stachybotrys chartarum IBT 7711]KFA55978.1 hypothetical protein S40293_04010 [Stachybotrys chartarum IBT 40293]KFA71480.1 hypothetical protein S40288_09201 [Stachybotrys chartarum IBT 40288]